MAKYKVKVIGMLIRGNKVANHGEVVDSVNLLTDADTLVKDGFIESVDKAEEAKQAEEAVKNPLIDNAKKK